ncbi:MAG: hypothetical protein MdMp014T_0158 [Treponematales bacterium]
MAKASPTKSQVWGYLDTEVQNNRFHTYYEIEFKFGGKQCRPVLCRILHSAYEQKRYDSHFWDVVFTEGQYPIVAKSAIMGLGVTKGGFWRKIVTAIRRRIRAVRGW